MAQQTHRSLPQKNIEDNNASTDFFNQTPSPRIPQKNHSGTLPTEPPAQLDILWHNGYPLSMNGAKICIFHDPGDVRLPSRLQRHNRMRLETQIRLEILRNLAHETLERELAAQKFGAFLVFPNLPESDCSRPVEINMLSFHMILS